MPEVDHSSPLLLVALSIFDAVQNALPELQATNLDQHANPHIGANPVTPRNRVIHL